MAHQRQGKYTWRKGGEEGGNWPTEWNVLGDRTEALGSDMGRGWAFLAGRALVPAVQRTSVEGRETWAGTRAQISGWWSNPEWQGGEGKAWCQTLYLWLLLLGRWPWPE